MLSYESDVGAALGRAWVVLEAKSNLHCAKPKYAICYTTFVAAGGGLWRKRALELLVGRIADRSRYGGSKSQSRAG